jgi:haloalkane dehalogenase
MKALRTPDERFANLPGYQYQPNYLNIDDGEGGELRLHYLDEGDTDALPIVLLHGEPSWCYLYRKMVPGLVAAGYRVLAPDLIGFGRSDKPTKRSDYTYQNHIDWLSQWFDAVVPDNRVLFCQDWGGLLGLRIVAAQAHRFAGVIAANTLLPTGDEKPSEAFMKWQNYSQTVPEFPVGGILQGATVSDLSDEVRAAYDAPFPDESFKSGARRFPLLVPVTADNPASQANRDAWKKLAKFEQPFLTAFSDQDPVTAGIDQTFQKLIPGCRGQEHLTIKDGGHFLQEDKGEELAAVIIQFIHANELA